jgi:hypothetical protein
MDLLKYYENLSQQLADIILDEECEFTPEEENKFVTLITLNIGKDINKLETIIIHSFFPDIGITKRKGRPVLLTLNMLYKACKRRIRAIKANDVKAEELAYERMISRLNI